MSHRYELSQAAAWKRKNLERRAKYIEKSGYVHGLSRAEREINQAAWTTPEAKAWLQTWRDDFGIQARSSDSSSLGEHGPLKIFGGGLIENGWSFYPQDRRDRVSARVSGLGRVRWSVQQTRQPTLGELRAWIGGTGPDRQKNASFNPNVALILGSLNRIWALDIDVDDPALAEAVITLADKHFGRTEFRRVGRSPRMALLYRYGKKTEHTIFTISRKFIDDDGERRHGLEILAHGRSLTSYGFHHSTGQAIRWVGERAPAFASPEEAPEVSRAQLEAFLEAVHHDLRRLDVARSIATPQGDFRDWSQADDVWVPSPTSHGDWVYDEQGKIVDGREGWAVAVSWAICTARENRALCSTPEGVKRLTAAMQDLARGWVHTDDRRSEDAIAILCATRIRSAANKVAKEARISGSGGFRIRSTGEGKGVVERPIVLPAPLRPADSSADWLPTIGAGTPIRAEGVEVATPTEAALPWDRPDLVNAATVRTFLREATSLEGEAEVPLYILKSPTGSGKTVNALQELGEFLAGEARAEDAKPVLFLTPSYRNIVEVRDIWRGKGFDLPFDAAFDLESEEPTEADAAAAEAHAMELSAEELRRAGTTAMVWKGRTHAGCERSEDVRRLADAGLSAAKLCSSKVRGLGGWTDVECPFMRNADGTFRCGYHRQRENASRAAVVILPSTYLTLPLPEELKNPRAVIIDESTIGQLLHAARMPLSVLSLPRRLPRLRVSERHGDAETFLQSLLEDRTSACAAVIAGHKNWIAPEDAVPRTGEGDRWIASTIRVLRDAQEAALEITPRTGSGEIEDVVADRGHHTRLELRFWLIVQERRQTENGAGDRDHRLQAQVWEAGGEEVRGYRVAWRTTPNWASAPTLLLDASADERIVAKIWNRTPTVHIAKAPMHMHVVAVADSTNSGSVLYPAEDTDRAATRRAKILDIITQAAVANADGRVLVAATKAVREELFRSVAVLPNVDIVHYGGLRGLDFAKAHSAAISIGRTEQPLWVVDGLAAALTYDDAEPEGPYDARGDGTTDGQTSLLRPYLPRRVQMRTGHMVTVTVPQFPERHTWARRVEAGWREEELRQTGGRLRPVYREGKSPLWLLMSRCIPEDLIVDELLSLDAFDFVPASAEILRRCRGILCRPLAQVLCRELLAEQRVVSERDWNRLLRNVGIVEGDPRAEKFRRVTWIDSIDQTYEAWMMVGISDPGAHLQTVLMNAGMDLAMITESDGGPATAAVAKTPDAVDEAIDTARAAQREEELRRRARVQDLFDRYVWNVALQKVAVQTEDLEPEETLPVAKGSAPITARCPASTSTQGQAVMPRLNRLPGWRARLSLPT